MAASLAGSPAPPPFTYETFADVLGRVGNVPPHRIRLHPAPGTATERDVERCLEQEGRLFELIDGILVEKVMGFEESRMACQLIGDLRIFLKQYDLGAVVGADGAMRLFPGMVRIPDVSFISWGRYPKEKRKRGTIPDLAPDLAVEVLSRGNTRKEMAIKLRDYFLAGVRLVWFFDPKARTVRVFTSPDRSLLLAEGETLDGGDVLPGFTLTIREWFAEAERQGPG